MKERPIIMSGPMVHAIMEDRKTQTRRVMKAQPGPTFWNHGGYVLRCQGDSTMRFHFKESGALAELSPVVKMSYGQPGDRLWVRETGWQPKESSLRELRAGADTWPKYAYDADGISRADAEDFKQWGWKRRPSIFMPRWASRLTLEIVNIRVERVQEITEEDALAEGIMVQVGHLWRPLGFKEPMRQYTHRQAFSALWDSLNAKRGYGWDKNPWVWVIEFKRI